MIGPLFDMGDVVATPGVLEAMQEHKINAIELLRRHAQGDWGDLDEYDQGVNMSALENGERLMSSYVVDNVKIWIITERDRSVTTLLLPDEY